MTKTEVQNRVREIRGARNDDEKAHGLEDRLYVDVLTAIANGHPEDARAIARAALETQRIKFARWTS